MLWQKNFVVTSICHDKHMFYLDRHTFATTKDVFCRNKCVCHDKSMLVMTKLLQQSMFVPTNICHDKSFVAIFFFVMTNMNVFYKHFLLQLKRYLWQLLPVIEKGFAQKLCAVPETLCRPRNFVLSQKLCAVPETLCRPRNSVPSQKLCAVPETLCRPRNFVPSQKLCAVPETLCCPRNFAQVLLCTVLLETCLISNIFCLGFYFRTLAVDFVSGQVKQTILK